MPDPKIPKLSHQNSAAESLTSQTSSVASISSDTNASQSVETPADPDASLAACIFTAQQNREQRLKTQRQRALKSVAKYNTQLNQQRVAERKSYFDLQTNLVHVPRRMVRVLPTDSELYQMQLAEAQSGNGPYKRSGTLLEQATAADLFARKTGAYPVSLMFSPSQYCDNVPVFSPNELGYLPLTTAVHTAPPYAVHCLNMSAEEFRKMRGFDGKEGEEMSEDESDVGESEDAELKETTEKKPDVGKVQQNGDAKIIAVSPTKNSPERKPPAPGGRRRESINDVEMKDVTKSPEAILPVSNSLPAEIPIPPCPPNTCYHCHCNLYQPPPPPVEVTKPPPKRRRGKKPPPELTAADLAKEKLFGCSKCAKKLHPSCMQLSKATLFSMSKYRWQCSDCKVCLKCNSAEEEEKLMFCDFCDRGYHNFCVGVQRIPHGRWLCAQCAVCALCSATRPNADGKRGRACIWQIDWDEDNAGNVTAVRTLCYPCHKKKRGIKAEEEDAVDEDSKSEQVDAD